MTDSKVGMEIFLNSWHPAQNLTLVDTFVIPGFMGGLAGPQWFMRGLWFTEGLVGPQWFMGGLVGPQWFTRGLVGPQ